MHVLGMDVLPHELLTSIVRHLDTVERTTLTRVSTKLAGVIFDIGLDELVYCCICLQDEDNSSGSSCRRDPSMEAAVIKDTLAWASLAATKRGRKLLATARNVLIVLSGHGRHAKCRIRSAIQGASYTPSTLTFIDGDDLFTKQLAPWIRRLDNSDLWLLQYDHADYEGLRWLLSESKIASTLKMIRLGQSNFWRFGGQPNVQLPQMPELQLLHFDDDYFMHDSHAVVVGEDYTYSEGFFDESDDSLLKTTVGDAICSSSSRIRGMRLCGYANSAIKRMLEIAGQEVEWLAVYNWDDSFAPLLPQLKYLHYRFSRGRMNGPRPSLPHCVEIEQSR